MLIKINTENDVNGNARRGWIHTASDGGFVAFIEEGHDNGGVALRELRKTEPEAFPAVNVTPKEYKRIKKLVA